MTSAAPTRKPAKAAAAPTPADDRPKLRGRPRKDQVTLIDSDILALAAELFGEFGYAGTSMEAVAARAGVTKRTLYARYPDKTALIKEVINTIIQRVMGTSPPVFADVRSCLSYHVENYFVICSDPTMRVIVNMADASVQHIPELAEIGHQLTQGGVINIARELVETANKTGVTIREPEFISACLLDLAAGHFTRVRVLKLRSDFASYKFAAQRIVSLLMAGINADNAKA